MGFFQKWLTKKIDNTINPDKEHIVPPNAFCGVFDDDYCLEVLLSGTHMVPEKYKVTPPITFNIHTITIGYPYSQNDEIIAFYKLTIRYKITDPYLYLVNADRGEYVSAEAAMLVHSLLWNKSFDEIRALIGNGYEFNGPAANMVFNSVDQYGVKILSASCILSSLEEIRSVPHDEKILDAGESNIPYIRGYFHNTTGLSEDDMPN